MAKILLVEDDKSLREIYGVRLMAEGYEIVSAGDGEEALAMAIKERPDLIVSDVMMPKISGFDMLDILRSTSETKDVKVIMMTALSSDDQRARGESLGADRYLVKSQVGIEDVVRTVHDVLGDGVSAPAPAATPAAAPVTPAPAVPVIDTSVASVPAAPAFTAPAPAPEPLAPAPVAPMPEPLPTPTAVPVDPAPAPAPVTAPVFPAAPAVDPASAYAAPLDAAPAPAPVVSPTDLPPLVMTPPEPAPMSAPAPVAAPAPGATLTELPVNPAPVAVPAPVAAPLPQPTAPFSSPAPASLGERVIEPLTTPDPTIENNIALQMEQALNTQAPSNQGLPPVPPVA